MQIRWIKVLVLVFFVFTTGCHVAPAAEEDTIRTHANLRGQIQELVEETDFSGVILVADQGDVILEEAYQATSMNEAFQVKTNTPFAIASITKSFTTILILQLAEDGVLGLDDPIRRHLPSFSGSYANRVTVRHLLQNRSGLPNYTAFPDWFDSEYKQSLTPDKLLVEIAALSPSFEPGSDYLYSNANFYLLGQIIESVTGEAYETVLSDRLLVPLELAGTGQLYDQTRASMIAKSVVREDGGFVHVPISNPYVFKATASMVATARDLYRWQRALRGDAVLTEASKAVMFDPKAPMTWTVGAVPLETGERLSIQTVDGGLIGYTSMVTRFPEHDGVVIILNNNEAGYETLANLTLVIANALYGA